MSNEKAFKVRYERRECTLATLYADRTCGNLRCGAGEMELGCRNRWWSVLFRRWPGRRTLRRGRELPDQGPVEDLPARQSGLAKIPRRRIQSLRCDIPDTPRRSRGHILAIQANAGGCQLP